MSTSAISVDFLAKQYFIAPRRERYRTLRDTIGALVRRPFASHSRGPKESVWALRDVTFNIRHGDIVGLIGRNGSGKSTLLKLLSRITEPTQGRALITGRVASLLEVGTGFHPELTGRENIYLSGAILGMRKIEIDNSLDAIIDFAEVGQYVDTPVKHYSSGMYLKLAFSVAAHLNPDILLVDEVLAVGDKHFQNKSMGKMEEVAKQGRTIVLVSHNMSAIAATCSRCLLLHNGRLLYDGATAEAIAAYSNSGNVLSPANESLKFRRAPWQMSLMSPPSLVLDSTEYTTLVYSIFIPQTVRSALFKFVLSDSMGRHILELPNTFRIPIISQDIALYSLRLILPPLWLAPGVYSAQLRVIPDDIAASSRFVSDPSFVTIQNPCSSGHAGTSLILPRTQWSLDQEMAT